MKGLILILVSLLICISCSKNSPQLPETMPDDFQLHYLIDGGMSNYRVDMKLYHDSILLYIRKEGEKLNKKERLPAGEYQRIYDFLRSAQLNEIRHRTFKEIVHDRGGRTLSVKWKENEIYLSDAQSNFIDEDSYEKWTRVVDEIEKFAGISQ